MIRWLIPALMLLSACATPPAADPRAGLTRARLDGSARPILLAEVPTRDLAATLAPRGERQGVATWHTAANQTLSFRDGVLIATRGLGDDLMSADVSGTLAALNGGPLADYPRLMTYLDGEGRTLMRAMICAMCAGEPATVRGIGLDFPVTLRVETCHTTGLSVENRYWQDADGTMRRAEQWIGPGLGTLATELLTR